MSFAGRAYRPAFKKWWEKIHKYGTVNGLVVEERSPYQLRIMAPLFRNIVSRGTFHSKNMFISIPGLSLGVGTYYWALDQLDKNERATWP